MGVEFHRSLVRVRDHMSLVRFRDRDRVRVRMRIFVGVELHSVLTYAPLHILHRVLAQGPSTPLHICRRFLKARVLAAAAPFLRMHAPAILTLTLALTLALPADARASHPNPHPSPNPSPSPSPTSQPYILALRM